MPERWFGIFVKTGGGRLSFFPGFGFLPRVTSSSNAQGGLEGFALDHLTLEADLDRWHLTTSGSLTHRRGGRTLDLTAGRRYWLGVSVRSKRDLEIVPEQLSFSVQVPAQDATRRIDALQRAREGAVFQTLLLHPRARIGDEPGYLHVCVVVGPTGFPLYDGDLVVPHAQVPFANHPLDPSKHGIRVRSHRVHVADIDVQLDTMWIPGTLNESIVLQHPD
jgi:hypothetical protein